VLEDKMNKESRTNKLKETIHNFNDVLNYAKDKKGNIDIMKMEKLEGIHGYNGRRGCDVLQGPCSCGAWH
jgi:hypothetical protein